MSTKISQADAEKMLKDMYQMKYVSFKYPGYPQIVGRCDRIMIGTPGTKDAGDVLIFINDRKYSVSPEALQECLTLFKDD